MNNKRNTDGMNKAAKQKRADTIKQVKDALTIMEKESIPINFLSVYKFTGVSRSWLYKESAIKGLILKEKSPLNNKLMQDQAVKIKSLGHEIEILTKQNKNLRKTVEELRQQLEVAYGEIYKQGS